MPSQHPIIAPLHCLLEFATAVKVKRKIEEVTAGGPLQTFWIYVTNLMMDRAAIEWCKVFGSRKQHTHWTCVLPRRQHRAARTALLKATNLTEHGWTDYHKSVLSYRNRLAAHHDLKRKVATYPHYDVGLQAAYIMYDRLYALLADNERGGLNSSLNRWSSTIAGNMAAIIRKAVVACAKLPSNVRTARAHKAPKDQP